MGQSSTKAGAVVWGSSEHGQLGVGSLPTEDRAVTPRLVEGLRHVHVRHVACGGHYSAALSESGEVHTWGCGKDGQLGHGDAKDVHAPKPVRSLQSKLIRSVSCAEHHCAAVSESGVLYTWGRGQNGRLGHGGTDNELIPKAVEALVGNHVSQVACGEFHTACVILNPTHVYTWGLGLTGRLGHGDEADRNLPTAVDALAGSQVASLACGGHHSAVISDMGSGQILTWGGGAFGKLGHGNRLAQLTPKAVFALQGRRLVQVSLGPHHSAALTQKGELFTWGQAGRLGHASEGAEVDEMAPRQVAALSGVFVVQVSCGHTHCAVVTEIGDVWAWGASRAFGHTELGAVPNVPTMIKVLSSKAIIQVVCGVTHNIALSDYGRLTHKAALAAARNNGIAAPAVSSLANSGRRGEANEDQGADAKPTINTAEPPLPLAPIDEYGPQVGEDGAEKGHGMLGGKVQNVPQREVAFLSAELKAYQEQTLRLAKLLQETRTKSEALQNENSFLKSELEVMHQCSNDADERLDTLRRHFNERIREMERRYNDKERAWRETFGRLRSHLGLGGDVDAHAPGHGSVNPGGGVGLLPDTAAAAAAAVMALAESGTMGPISLEEDLIGGGDLPVPAVPEASPGTAATAAAAASAGGPATRNHTPSDPPAAALGSSSATTAAGSAAAAASGEAPSDKGSTVSGSGSTGAASTSQRQMFGFLGGGGGGSSSGT